MSIKFSKFREKYFLHYLSLISILLFLLTPFFRSEETQAQSTQSFYTLTTIANPYPDPDESFGFDLALLGTNVIIPAPRDNSLAEDSGVLYVFTATGTRLLTINNPSPDVGDQFGYSVASFGGNVVVGTPFDDTSALNSGIVYVFDGTTGSLLLTINNPDPQVYGIFGYRVTSVGTYIAVSASTVNDGSGTIETGAVHIFDGATGAFVRTINNPSPLEKDKFGYETAPVGTNLIISAIRGDEAGTDTGTVYVYNPATGSQVLAINNPSPDLDDYFGNSVAAVGTNILVGAPYDDTTAEDSGRAYLFDGTTGSTLLTIDNPTPEPTDYFGFAVSSVGTYLLFVGAVHGETNFVNSGAAYLFSGIDGSLLVSSSYTDVGEADYFGNSVLGLGTSLVVGAFGEDTGGDGAGTTYAFIESGLSGSPSQGATSIDARPGQLYCNRPIEDYANVIQGSSGNDTLTGTEEDDLIGGFGGNDTISGLGGDDCLIGGAGKDTIYGGDGNDFILGQNGSDTLLGELGNDIILAELGNDKLDGGDGDDSLNGGDDFDSCRGGINVDTKIYCERLL